MTALEKAAAKAVELALKAQEIHGPFSGPHEAFGLVCEEVHEFFLEVCEKNHLKVKLRDEAIDVAVVMIRYAAQIEDEWSQTADTKTYAELKELAKFREAEIAVLNEARLMAGKMIEELKYPPRHPESQDSAPLYPQSLIHEEGRIYGPLQFTEEEE